MPEPPYDHEDGQYGRLSSYAPEGVYAYPGVYVSQPLRRRYWLHILLFALTVFTTLVVGARLQHQFDAGQPMFIEDDPVAGMRWMLFHPGQILRGWPFSVGLLGILLAHEMGHYLWCVRHRVQATLPFFLPAPSIIGTFGAFIQIRSPFPSRAALLEIGIMGPIAGFVVAVPVMLAGLAMSHPAMFTDGAQPNLDLPIIFQMGWATLGMAGSHLPLMTGLQDMALHPLAIAAWIGMLATALNLIPGGQLDGGHIVFSLSPRAHFLVTRLAILALIPLIFFCWTGWAIWALGLWLTRKHPQVPEWPDLSLGHRQLLLIAALLLLLTFTPAPIHQSSVWELLRGSQ